MTPYRTAAQAPPAREDRPRFNIWDWGHWLLCDHHYCWECEVLDLPRRLWRPRWSRR